MLESGELNFPACTPCCLRTRFKLSIGSKFGLMMREFQIAEAGWEMQRGFTM